MTDYTEITEGSKAIMRENIKDSPLREQRYGLIPKGKALINSAELEELRAKAAAFDWIQENWPHYDLEANVDSAGYWTLFSHSPMTKETYLGNTLLEAVNNAIGES